MTRNEDNRMWAHIEQSCNPTRDELDRTERELDGLRAMPLDEVQARQLIKRAGIAMERPRDGRRKRAKWAAAAMALIAVSAAAFVLDPGIIRQRYESPLLTMQFQQAVDSVSNAGTPRRQWQDAIGLLDGRCHDALQTLRHLSADQDPAVARAAREACQRLADGEAAETTANACSAAQAMRTALDESEPRGERRTALARLEELVSIGAAAMRNARAESPRARKLKSIYVTRFEADLEAARPTTRSAGSPPEHQGR